MDNLVNWLLKKEVWLGYRTRIDLLNEPENSPEAAESYKQMLNDAKIQQLLSELRNWPGPAMKRHNDAKLLYHKLAFLADIGVRQDQPVLADTLQKILQSSTVEGPFQIPGNIPTVFGGSGRDEPMWMLCDAPLISYALVKLGLGNEPAVQKSVEYLLSLVKDFGWPCAAETSLGNKFKGPGKRTHPCPYANLLMLKLIGTLPELHHTPEAKLGLDMILSINSRTRSSFGFLMVRTPDSTASQIIRIAVSRL